MASSKMPATKLFLQTSYTPELDSITDLETFFKVNDKDVIGIDQVRKGLVGINKRRSFYKTEHNEEVTKTTLSDARVHISNEVKDGHLVGVLRGVVVQKKARELKEMDWPVLIINYVGQPNIFGLPERTNVNDLTLERKGEVKANGTSLFVLQPEKQNNPLTSVSITNDSSHLHNCVARFVLLDSHIYLCIIAIEKIKKDSKIQAYSEDVQLYETYGTWIARQKKKPGNVDKPEPVKTTKKMASGNLQSSAEPRTRYQKKRSKDEQARKESKEDVPEPVKTNVRRLRSNEKNKPLGESASDEDDKLKTRSVKNASKEDMEQEGQASIPMPIHRVVRQLRSNDQGIPANPIEDEHLRRTRSGKKRSREELQDSSTPEEMSTKRFKPKEDMFRQISNSSPEVIQEKNTPAGNNHFSQEKNQLLKSSHDGATTTEEENVDKPKNRILRPRRENNQVTDQVQKVNSTKKILTKTYSVPVERTNSDNSSEKISRKKKRSDDDDENQGKEKRVVKKTKSKEESSMKPKSSSAPSAVLKKQLTDMKLIVNDPPTQYETLRFRKTFENGRRFTLHHVGILIHQTEECPVSKDNKNQSLAMQLENLRRSRMRKSDIEKKFIEDWYEVFKGLFDCKDVSNIKDSGCEHIKERIKQKKKQCERELGFIGIDDGVILILVFTSAFMENLQIKLNKKEDPVNLLTDIIFPLFQVEERSAQRFFPFVILETSTGVHVWKQSGKKTSEFEYIRYSAGAPNESVLEHQITLIISEMDKQLKMEYNNLNEKKTDLLKVLHHVKEENFKTFFSTECEAEKHKLCIEHSTTKPFTFEKPRDIEKDLEDDEVDGSFLLIQHCSDIGTDYNFELMHNRIVKPMRYLRCDRGLAKISDYYDKDDDEVDKLHKKADAEINKASKKVKINTIKQLQKIKMITARAADWEDISSRFPGLTKQNLRTLNGRGKFKITKKRKDEVMREIEEVAKGAVKSNNPCLVLIIQSRGKHDYFWLGEVPPEDDIEFESCICRYVDIIDKVREAGIKKLFIIAGHYSDDEKELPSGMYKGKYPRCTLGGTPSTYRIRPQNVRIENSIPQHAILWAAPPGYQLPLSKSKNSFSPLLDHFKQVMIEWRKEEEVNFDLIIQKANKISMKDPIGPESILLKNGDPNKKNPNLFTHSRYYLANTMIFNHSWKIKRTED